ncbi:MAG: alpha/beta hydrolase [Sulfitobacter sp.]
MPELALEDVTLHYEIEGVGPPLLLLAGMLSDSATWAGFAPMFTDHFTVIRPDNRTTGRTAPWDAPADCSHMAQDALTLMSHLGFEKFHVAGHSLGGLLALELATMAPEKIATIAIFASSTSRSARTAAVFDMLLTVRSAPDGEEMWLRALYPWIFGSRFFEDSANIETALTAARGYPFIQSRDAMALQIDALRNFQPKAKPEKLSCPALVLYAGQDVLLPPDLAQHGFAEIPDLTEATIEPAGHSIVWDATQEVAAHLSAFLTKHPI